MVSPERAEDRAFLLESFGAEVTVSPASGGRSWKPPAIFNRGPRPVDLDLGGQIAAVEISGSDPWLFMQRKDALAIRETDRITVAGEPHPFRVNQDAGPDEDDGEFRAVHLLEAAP